MFKKAQYIANIQGDSILSAYVNDSGFVPESLTAFDIVKQIQITVGKKYLQWIVNQYIQNIFNFEDLEIIKTDLQLFDYHKNQLDSKDIAQFSTLYTLRECISAIELPKSSKRQIEKLVKDEGVDLYYKDSEIAVYNIKTKDAAVLYGANTKWCTTMVHAQYFENYVKQGPIYIVITKEGKKFQIHFETNQIENEIGSKLNINKLVRLYPSLTDAFNEQGIKFNIFALILAPTHEQCIASIKRDATSFMLVRNPSIELCKYALSLDGTLLQYIDNQTPEMCAIALKQNPYVRRLIKINYQDARKVLGMQRQSLNAALNKYKNQRPN